jgi:hypothetical protein
MESSLVKHDPEAAVVADGMTFGSVCEIEQRQN